MVRLESVHLPGLGKRSFLEGKATFLGRGNGVSWREEATCLGGKKRRVLEGRSDVS